MNYIHKARDVCTHKYLWTNNHCKVV